MVSTKKRASKPRPKLELNLRLLNAAEILFGRHGPEGISLRQVAAAAGSSNHFAVQYHFGDKDGLVRAILERRLRTLEAKRGVMLDELVRLGRDREPRALLEVMLRPIADERDQDGRCSYASFLLTMMISTDLNNQWNMAKVSAPLLLHVANLLRNHLNFPREDLFLERINTASLGFLWTVVDSDRLAADDPSYRDEVEGRVDRALDFSAAGLMHGRAVEPRTDQS